jgi:pimeloyl-ACP methyl ester carboxylesterase
MPECSINVIRVHYDLHGSGDPLLLIMGLGASSAAWDPSLVDALAQDFQVITFDNRGTGRSDKPDEPYTLNLLADDAAALLDHLRIGRAHIFGVSMGGMIAQEFALNHAARVQTLTLGCTTFGGKNAVPAPPASLAILTASREGISAEEVIRRGWPLSYSHDYIESHRADLEAAIPRLLEHPTPPFAFRRHFEATLKLHTYSQLKEIKAPTLVVAGAEDVLIPARNAELIAAQIPGARLLIIPGVGHNFFTPGQESFLGQLTPFLKAHALGVAASAKP